MATEFVQRLPLWVDGGRTFFDEPNTQYEVPVYQRAFAWGTKSQDMDRPNEIDQLMDDIEGIIPKGAAEGDNIAPYFLGSMVVKKSIEEGTRCRVYEVIDGQQRLTALYMLFKCLGIPIKNELALTYKCRARSENAIKHIGKIISQLKGDESGVWKEENEPWWKCNDGKKCLELEGSICDGIRTILSRLKDDDFKKRLIHGLKYVNLYRIEVPENTDLNRYFEVMNTRGEQLEPQDIIKGRVVSYLAPCHRELFSKIWNACSDMNGYVQMHLDKITREQWFGEGWNEFPHLATKEKGGDENHKDITIWDAVIAKSNSSSFNSDDDDDEMEKPYDEPRFRSVIDFPHFLLNVIKVFKCQEIDKEKPDVEDWELSEKNLIPKFLELFPNSLTDDEQEKRAWQFAQFLLESRYLFDKYIVKRDYAGDNALGEWSIKELENGDDSSTKYNPTGLDADAVPRKELLMLQSSLRVSYTEVKSMHWVTKLLNRLWSKRADFKMQDFRMFVEKDVVVPAVKKGYEELKGCNFRKGTGTSHLLFNYLDFLLWIKDKEQYKNFVYEYRNSVEHWYPQHPSEGELEPWDTRMTDDCYDRDRFGNLCLLTPSTNSKFSNLPPAAKARANENAENTGSLKYRIMVKLTKDIEKSFEQSNEPGKATAKKWRDSACAEHEKTMLALLGEALGVKPNNDPA